MDDEIGSIYKVPSDELLGSGAYKKTAHEVEVVQMLEACELYDKTANVIIFGVVPKDINTVQIGLSKELKKSFELFMQTIIKSIEELDVQVEKVDDISLDEVIQELLL